MDRLVRDNEELQEYIFDLEQRVVGIDLEVERRLQEKAKASAGTCDMEPEGKNVAVLQREIKQLKSQYEGLALQERELKEREGKLAESEKSVVRR